MENQNDQTPTQSPPLPPSSDNHSYSAPKIDSHPHHGHHFIPSKLMIVLMLIVLVVVTGSGLYFANMKVNPKQVAVKPTPTSTPTPTPTDETASWKTYENSKDGYSFMYPPTWIIKKLEGVADYELVSPDYEPETPRVKMGIKMNIQIVDKALGTCPVSENYGYYDTQPAKVANQDAYSQHIDYEEGHKLIYCFNKQDDIWYVHFASSGLEDERKNLTTIEKILSTVKFIGQTSKVSPTSQAVFCTQEAKICPDGSYVSRQGPNCEFAPCP